MVHPPRKAQLRTETLPEHWPQAHVSTGFPCPQPHWSGLYSVGCIHICLPAGNPGAQKALFIHLCSPTLSHSQAQKSLVNLTF